MSQNRRGKGAAAAAAWLLLAPLLLLALYVLSVGPVALAVARGWVHPRTGAGPAFVRFYRPLQRLHDETPLRRPIRSYLVWWERQ